MPPVAMTLQDLEAQLLSLTPAEKAQAIQILAQSLANNWQEIRKTPGVMDPKPPKNANIPDFLEEVGDMSSPVIQTLNLNLAT